ncbi:MAG: DEAD/DEAH box helicase [Gammaproteobacteria bacterium]|nr:DEAD/DEAH box helicase [Gammaproteobacteria bacterium]MBU1488705.1 DEAD/DEAH box helicase [Gammaproteobacteria bacterium]MBU2067238.1 DEAD/DEAH box helicase [Gammaproteobacteria bacterium]MBU2138834.1 DEAD/DEAH box helicase [Gammaproteobacteria bacterium]MBU2217521.1 DEAD/DEAH box helicase [Gammaproteobacteria bacterium]
MTEDRPHLYPLEVPEQHLRGLAPQALLTLGSHVRVHFDARKGRMHEQTQHRAALAFTYQGHPAFGRANKDLLVRQPGAATLRIERDASGEAHLRQRLVDAGLQVALRQSEALANHPGEHFELSGEVAWLQFVQHVVPQLRRDGWHIQMHPEFQYNLAQIDDWYAEVEETREHDWFDLELGIEVDGQRISLLPILLQAIRRTPGLLSGETLAKRADDELLLVSLPHSTQRAALPYARLKPLLGTLGELFFREPGENNERLRLPRADAARLGALQQGPTLSWQGGERLRGFAQRLQARQLAPISAPAGLRAELRPYQLHGVAWMQTLGELEVGGILADDMGLGKTLQTLAYLLAEKQAGRLQQPALIIMPTSLIPNWQDEAARFTPQLRVLALHGTKRRELFQQIAEHDVLLTTYALLPRDLKILGAYQYPLLILDEAQNIKNPRSKAALAAGQLHARQRLCLTGTPLENHLGELWSLFNFLMPGWLGDSKAFTQDYRLPIERQGNAQRLAHLHGRIRPFVLRRRKEEVASELPPKTEITHWVELSPAQRDRYETLRLAMDKKVRAEIARQGMARSQIVILEALLRLRQACCDLRLLDGNASGLTAADSGKLSALLAMLEELVGEGRRVLVFSQFTSLLELIEPELDARQVAYTRLTGSTQDRRTPVQQFQAGAYPVFLISLKAGGAGLNLTAADTVIHVDPWWNPAAEAQASDRAYRIGQDKPVFVYKLITRGSVEEKIQRLQQGKANLARGVLEGGSQAQWQLSEDDLQALFAPLEGP